jgi:hypothetical protein
MERAITMQKDSTFNLLPWANWSTRQEIPASKVKWSYCAPIAKLAIVLISSIIFVPSAVAVCSKASGDAEIVSTWEQLEHEYGRASFPDKLRLCVGRSFFFEIKNGAKMLSVLDRQRFRIVLRRRDAHALRHELAHLYLDLRWRMLPYRTAELLVEAMSRDENCAEPSVSKLKRDTLEKLWQKRNIISMCEKKDLLRHLFQTTPEIRATLPVD